MEKWPFPEMWQESHEMSPERLIVLVSKDVLKYFGDITKSHRGQPGEAPAGQIRNNLSPEVMIITGYLQNKTNPHGCR